MNESEFENIHFSLIYERQYILVVFIYFQWLKWVGPKGYPIL